MRLLSAPVLNRSRFALLNLLVILLAACSSGVETETFFYPTDFERAQAIFEGQSVGSGQLAPLWRENQRLAGLHDFGAGFYTLSGADLDFASAWARAIAARNCSERWGVIAFSVPIDRLRTYVDNGAVLSFETKVSRPDNAPVLTSPAYDRINPANWLEFVEYNRHIRDLVINRAANKRWGDFAWIEGPIWTPADSGFTSESVDEFPRFPDDLHQRNWIAAAELLNASDVERQIFTGSADAGDPELEQFLVGEAFEADC